MMGMPRKLHQSHIPSPEACLHSSSSPPHVPTALAAAAGEAGAGSDERPEGAEAAGEGLTVPSAASLPLGLVRKTMLLDGDVARVSSEGLRAVGVAADAFVGLLARAALASAAGDKRKNFRFGDVLAVAKRDRRMAEMGLAEVLAEDPSFAEVRVGRAPAAAREREPGRAPTAARDARLRRASVPLPTRGREGSLTSAHPIGGGDGHLRPRHQGFPAACTHPSPLTCHAGEEIGARGWRGAGKS